MASPIASDIRELPSIRDLATRSVIQADDLEDLHAVEIPFACSGASLGGR